MAKLKPINRLLLGISGFGALVLVALVLCAWIPKVVETTHLMMPATSNPVQKVQQARALPTITPHDVSADGGDAGKPSLSAKLQKLDKIRADLTNPQSRAIRLQRARIQVEMKYARLFRRLTDLEPEKVEKLKTILVEQDLNQMIASLPTDSELVSDQPTQVSQRLEANRSASDEQIKNLVGSDDYASYTTYMDSRAYEQTVGQIVNIIQSRGVAVGDEQQQAILDAYGSAMKQLGQAISAESNQENGPPYQAPAGDSQRAGDLGRFDQQLADTMSKALPPGLFKQFMDAQYAQEDASR
jgi:hypothetical protein